MEKKSPPPGSAYYINAGSPRLPGTPSPYAYSQPGGPPPSAYGYPQTAGVASPYGYPQTAGAAPYGYTYGYPQPGAPGGSPMYAHPQLGRSPPQNAYGPPGRQGTGASPGGGYGTGRGMPQAGVATITIFNLGQDDSSSNPFSDKEIRQAFISKVFGLLTVQLMLNVAIIAAFLFIEGLRLFAQNNPMFYILTSVASFIFLISVICCFEELLHKVPVNYIILFVFTILEGLSLGALSAFYKVEHVMAAAGLTAIITLCLTLFARQTKIDFTVYNEMLFVLLIVFILFGIMLAIFGVSKILFVVYSCLGVLLFSAYLVVDVQLVVGGKHLSISPEDYIMATLNIYIDVLNLFVYILNLISELN